MAVSKSAVAGCGEAYAYDEVEAISLPEHNEGHGIALEGGPSGRLCILTPSR